MTRTRKSRWLLGLAAVATVAAVVTVPNGPAEAQQAPRVGRAATADDGAKVVEEVRVDQRTLDLKIESPALGKAEWVRLLLPRDWDSQTTRTWPSLYLLHGCCEVMDYKSWTTFTDVNAWSATKDMLVVQPSDGAAGMFSAWWNFGGSNKPDWETFHTTEVLQILERGYGAGTRRAVAGLSIGGYGALAYAYRHPGMFKAAASYSGAPNTTLWGIPTFLQGIISRAGLTPYNLWGNEFTQADIWRDHNPYDNIEKLRGVGLYLSVGNGQVGPLDKPGATFDLIEPLSQVSTKTFADKLKQLNIPATTNFYGNGTHSWPYWQRELKASWPVLAAGLGLPV